MFAFYPRAQFLKTAHTLACDADLGPLARGTANHRRENYLQTQHSTRPALEPPPVEATSLGTQPASLRCALASRGRTVFREVLPAHHRIFIQGGGRAAGHGVSSVDHRIAMIGGAIPTTRRRPIHPAWEFISRRSPARAAALRVAVARKGPAGGAPRQRISCKEVAGRRPRVSSVKDKV